MIRNTLHLTFIILLMVLVSSCRTTRIDGDGGKGKSGKKISQEEQLQISALFIDATREKILGNRDKALGLYAQCIQRNPAHHASMYEMAGLLNDQRKWDDALVLIRNAVKLNPENKWYQFLYADLLMNKRLYDEAAKLYKQLVAKYPGYLELYYDWASVYLYSGKYADAIRVYDMIEAQSGISEELSIQKEKLYLQLGKVNKAVEEIQKLIDAFPAETRYRGILAELYMAQGMPVRALEIYEQIKSINPKEPLVHLSLAEYYKAQGDSERYLEELKTAFSNETLDIDTKVRILLSYYSVSESDTSYLSEAFMLASILVNTHPADPKAFSIYGDFLYRSKKYDEARTAFRKVIELDNSKYIVWQQLLEIEALMGDYAALLKESTEAIDLFPEQSELYFFNGLALYKAKKYAEGARILVSGLEYATDPGLQLRIYSLQGDLYYAYGKYDMCADAFSKALKIDPKNIYVLNNYSYYLALQGTDLAHAAEMAKKLNELVPGNPSYQDTYAWVYYRSGDYQNALVWIEKAVSGSGGGNPAILEHYGDILYKLGRTDDALKQWNNALSAGGSSPALLKKISDKLLYD